MRVKVEADPRADGVPQCDGDDHPPGGYFEHHVKLLLAGEPTDVLTELAEYHGAHLSRNAFKLRADGRHERFVTLRSFRVARDTAERRRDELLATLRAAGFDIVSVESEYSLFDSRLELDAGWLAHPEG